MKISDIVTTGKKATYPGFGKKVITWVATMFGIDAVADTKNDALSSVVKDVEFLVRNHYNMRVLFDKDGQTHVIRSGLGCWEHTICGPNRHNCTSTYQASAVDDVLAIIKSNWDVI